MIDFKKLDRIVEFISTVIINTDKGAVISTDYYKVCTLRKAGVYSLHYTKGYIPYFPVEMFILGLFNYFMQVPYITGSVLSTGTDKIEISTFEEDIFSLSTMYSVSVLERLYMLIKLRKNFADTGIQSMNFSVNYSIEIFEKMVQHYDSTR